MWYGLEAEEYQKEYKDKDLLKRIFKYFRPYRKEFAIVTFFLTLSSLTYASIPILISIAITSLGANLEPIYIISVVALIFCLNFLGWIFSYFRQKFTAVIIGNIVLDVRQSANAAVIDRDLSFFDKYPIGKIVSRVNSDSRDFGNTVELTIQVISSLFIILFLLIVMVFINPFLP